MRSEDAYVIWAPEESPWSPWVKPILFASEPDWDGSRDPELEAVHAPIGVSGYRDDGGQSASADVATAYVVDLPGALGVAWGIALARKGWRPVPLYSALRGASAVRGAVAPSEPTAPASSELVDVTSIVQAMRRATAELPRLALAPHGPPVFLLDADRRLGRDAPLPGRFDNRSISLPTDFPSAVFLRSRGIARVVLVQPSKTEPQEDLAHTLLAWQEGGIAILATTVLAGGPPDAIEVAKPSRFRAVLYRFLATLGLRRSPLGGFGGMIPVPSSG